MAVKELVVGGGVGGGTLSVLMMSFGARVAKPNRIWRRGPAVDPAETGHGCEGLLSPQMAEGRVFVLVCSQSHLDLLPAPT